MSGRKTLEKERLEELALVDHPSNLTPWELRFCHHYATGGQMLDSFKQVCALHELQETDKELRRKAVALLKKPAVKKYIRHLHKRLEDMGVASMLEVQMYLTEIMRTPIEEIDSDHPLCQKKITTVTFHKDGSRSEKTTLEMVPKMDAVKALIAMKGWNAPTNVNVNHTGGGVMLVPMAENVTDWEAAARASQAALMKDAIDV